MVGSGDGRSGAQATEGGKEGATTSTDTRTATQIIVLFTIPSPVHTRQSMST